MNPLLGILNREQTQSLLNATAREVHGPGARVGRWSSHLLSKRGKQRTVRYELDVCRSDPAHARLDQWVGKFYETDEAGRSVAATLRELARTDCRARGGMVIPTVLAYHAPGRLLLSTYESGESIIAALARQPELVLSAIGRALAVLHQASVNLDGFTSADAVLEDLRPRIDDLCLCFPGETAVLRLMLIQLEEQRPRGARKSSFLHGDLGPAQLLWQGGRIVILDFDNCTRGDPALDLGNLLTQLRRLKLRKPSKLPEFAPLRQGILDAYRHWSGPDRILARQVAWYEIVALLRKIHFLAFDTTRHPEAEAARRRRVEAMRLLEELPVLLESEEASKFVAR